MPNFKRRRHKSRRAGCLLCKPHKHQGARKLTKVKGRKGLTSLRESYSLDDES